MDLNVKFGGLLVKKSENDGSAKSNEFFFIIVSVSVSFFCYYSHYSLIYSPVNFLVLYISFMRNVRFMHSYYH